ncbi:hypothetical protein [Christiangramia salexigens]|uniref:Uncharacterized protein n=1 Tax=Christiangramia salexigens TaxID=1913577 RepID=A0A1L3J504_9FLAO|nr:hypothetical protein [Christiangramia salexigens]APG60183.1 hypothetical protein LPB144_07050 [Christiangramia salexigens]
MKYEKLGEFIYMPKHIGKPLQGRDNVKFNYYLSSQVNGKKIDLDITTKLFHEDEIYIRKACFRVSIGEIEACVKDNLIDHMRSLGMDEENIPKSLNCRDIISHTENYWAKNAY